MGWKRVSRERGIMGIVSALRASTVIIFTKYTVKSLYSVNFYLEKSFELVIRLYLLLNIDKE